MFQYEKINQNTSKYKYRLIKDYVHDLQFPVGKERGFDWVMIRYKLAILMAGYCWNGLDYFPDFKWMIRASAIHDALCQLTAMGMVARLDADNEFRATLIKDCPTKGRMLLLPVISLMYYAVRSYSILMGK